jgi:hypothetical protein
LKIRFALMASVLLALSACQPAFAASTCIDEAAILKQLELAGAPESAITITRDPQFISDYHKGLGVALPDDVAPAVFLYAVGPRGVFVALFDENNCMIANGAISHQQHVKALAFARDAAAGV